MDDQKIIKLLWQRAEILFLEYRHIHCFCSRRPSAIMYSKNPVQRKAKLGF